MRKKCIEKQGSLHLMDMMHTTFRAILYMTHLTVSMSGKVKVSHDRSTETFLFESRNLNFLFCFSALNFAEIKIRIHVR